MVGLLQRVTNAQVTVDGDVIASIASGLLVLVGIELGDNEQTLQRLLERVLGYRVFPDEKGRMNRSVCDVRGGVLFVPNFTLVADTSKGTRASFSPSATPARGEELYRLLVEYARERHANVGSGVFGRDMQVSLTNDGPVTFWLRVR